MTFRNHQRNIQKHLDLASEECEPSPGFNISLDPFPIGITKSTSSVGNPPLDMAAGGRMTPALFTSLGARNCCQLVNHAVWSEAEDHIL